MNENQLIEKIRQIVGPTGKKVVAGIGDDAAVVKWTRKKYLLVSCDTVMEGVHFLPGKITWQQVGRKSLAVSLSDIAAMSGLPLYAIISLGLPTGDRKLVAELYQGINQLAKKYKVSLIGGNLTYSPKVFIDITVLGQVEKKLLVLRSGGSPGDKLFVTGTLGGTQDNHHFTFEPRIKLARRLTSSVPVKAMMDISDGLAQDLPRLASACRTGFFLYLDQLPFSSALLSLSRSKREAIWHALTDGEDYELLFAVSRNQAHRVPSRVGDVRITLIGELTPGETAMVTGGRKLAFTPAGFDHFRRSAEKNE
ncbi:MAG: thiamine-phosphate kinase [Candidatus Omnitrophica bacterium]|nr:thiamine-phosphate kinase [Candidatus Omnitrophota bacterium]